MSPIGLLAACLLDLCLGDPRGFTHPVILMGRLISMLEEVARKITEPGRSRRMAGGAIALVVVSLSYAVTLGVIRAAAGVQDLLGWGASVFFAYTTLAARTLHREAAKIAADLQRDDLEGARRDLAGIVGRDTEALSREEVIRAAVETVSENSSDGVIAPLLYLTLGGAPLAMAYKAVNTLDSMLGYKNEKYIDFGYFPARLDDLANYIPARITGLLLVVVSFFRKGSGRDAFRIMRRDGRKHASPNAGIPEAAAAGALGVQLGGNNIYGGAPVEKPVIGEPVRSMAVDVIEGAVQLMYGAFFLMVLLGMLLRGLRGGI